MLLENISLGLGMGFFALIVAAAHDIRKREVPDWLSFSLSFFAIGYAIILSIYHQNAGFIANSAAGLVFGLGIGLLMFYTGQWGGGDSKLIMGLCAILGLSIPGISSLHGNYEIFVFLVNTLFVGALYGLAFSLYNAITHFGECKAEAFKIIRQKNVIIGKAVLLVFMLGSFASFMLTKSFDSAFIFAASVAMLCLFYAWILITSVEKVRMIKRIPISELTEGDWIVEPATKSGKTLVKPSKTGVTAEDLDLLKKSKVQSVVIKIGIPFVPSLLIAYTLTLVYGNWLMHLIY